MIKLQRKLRVGVNEMSEPLFFRLGGDGSVRQEKKSGWISFLFFFVYSRRESCGIHQGKKVKPGYRAGKP